MNNVKKLVKKAKDLRYNVRFNKFCMYAFTGVLAAFFFMDNAYAFDASDQIAGEIAKWIKRGGGLVGFFGAVQTAYGLRSDDPEAKSKGIKTCLSGAAVAGIAQGYSSWIQ